MGSKALIELTRSRQWQLVSRLQTADISASDSSAFTVVTYNILSEQLLKKSSYFSKIAPHNWSRPLRHELLLSELDCLNADIICLQEVDADYWTEKLELAMQQRGFACSGSWRRDGDVHEGVMTCVNTSAFDLVSVDVHRISDLVDTMIDDSGAEDKQHLHGYADAPQRCVIVQLKHKDTQNQLTVGNVHISYQRPPKYDLRAVQAAAVKRAVLLPGNAAVLCGDFNSTPDSLAYAAVTGKESGLYDKHQHDGPLTPLLQHAPTADGFLESAFAGAEPRCTLNLTNNAGCVDFIFLSPRSLRCSSRLLPACERISRSKDSAPDGVLPSDHLSIVAVLTFIH